MPTFTIFLRRSSRGSDHLGSLYLRVIHNRTAKSTRLVGCRLFPHEWDDARQMIVTSKNYEKFDERVPEKPANRVNDTATANHFRNKITTHNTHNAVSDSVRAKNSDRSACLAEVQKCIDNHLLLIENFAAELEKQGRYTVEELMCAFRLKTDDGKLLGYTEMVARELERSGQERTAKAYRTVARGLIKFNKGEDIPLEMINNRLIRSFEADLKSRGKLPNTTSYYMRNLRAIYNRAVAQKRVKARDEKPFAGVFVGVTKSRKRALNIDEIQKLHDIDFDTLLKEHRTESPEHHSVEMLHTAWKLFFFLLSCSWNVVCGYGIPEEREHQKWRSEVLSPQDRATHRNKSDQGDEAYNREFFEAGFPNTLPLPGDQGYEEKCPYSV